MNKEMIPVAFIKDKIEDYRYIMARATEKTAKSYLNNIRSLENLLSNWETFGKQWEREHETN